MKFEVLRSVNEVEDFFERLNDKFSFDTETTSLKYDKLELVGISFSDKRNNAYIPVGHRNKLDGSLVKGQVDLGWLLEFLNDKPFSGKKQIIAHNFVYDYKVLYKYDIDLYNHRWFDTSVSDHLLDENKSHKLKDIVKELFDDDYGVDTKNIQYMSISEAGEYAAKDAYYTYIIQEEHLVKLESEGLSSLFFKVEMPFLRAVARMEITGVLVDWDKVKSISRELEVAIPKMEEELYLSLEEPYEIQFTLADLGVSTIKGKYNFNSPAQLKSIIVDNLGLTITNTTATGNLSTGKDTLEELKEEHPFIKTLIKFKIANKLKSAFFDSMNDFKDSDNRVRCNLHNTGTKTGRLSSSKPNLQQLPNVNDDFPIKTRSCFVVPKGSKMITCDYSGQELRVLAHLTGCEEMIKAFKDGADFHQATADKFGYSRKEAKAVNFGIAYGKSAFGFAKDWKTTEDEAQKYLDKYFDQFPEIKNKIDETTNKVKRDGYVTSMTGRKRRFVKNEQGYYSNSSFRQAFNFLIQGFSADMIRLAAVKCLNVINRNPQWGLKMIFTVHDEIGFEVKEEYHEVAGVAIKKAFETAVKLRVPVVADVKFGDDYDQAK